jgi:hypothetical protein
MAEEWFYARDGQQFGPVAAPQLKQMAASGQILPTDMVWKPGLPQWVQASQLKGLLSGSAEQRALPAGNARTVGNEPTIPASGDLPPPELLATHQVATAGEPWYYGFIDGYTKIFLILGLAVGGVGALILLGTSLLALTQAQGAIGILLGVLTLLAGLLGIALWVLGLAFTASLFLLAVDAARNLRALRKHSGG